MVSKSQGKRRKGTRDIVVGGCSYRTRGKRRGVGSTWAVCRVTEADEAWKGGRDSLGAGTEERVPGGGTVASKGPCKVSQGAKECALGRQQGGLGGEEKELGGGAEGKQG